MQADRQSPGSPPSPSPRAPPTPAAHLRVSSSGAASLAASRTLPTVSEAVLRALSTSSPALALQQREESRGGGGGGQEGAGGRGGCNRRGGKHAPRCPTVRRYAVLRLLRAVSCSLMQSHAVSCSLMQSHAVSCRSCKHEHGGRLAAGADLAASARSSAVSLVRLATSVAVRGS